MPNKLEFYFGASDRQMESFIDGRSFRRSLVLNVLFHGDLVIPDIFFYISNYIHQTIVSDQPLRAFVAEALRCGAIMPAFRGDQHRTFTENLGQIRTQGIQGLHAEADSICEYLEEAVRGKRQHYRLWPSDPLSVGYARTLKAAFLSDPSTNLSPQFEQVWARLKDIRTAVMEGVNADEFGGIRRGDVLNETYFRVSKKRARINDVRDIWGAAQDKTLASDIMTFLKWCNYVYQYNQGRMFGLSPSLASMDSVDIDFSRHLTALDEEAEAGTLWTDEFAIPSEDALLTIDPKYIFEVRDSETGASYFDAVDRWQREPSENSSNILLDCLQKYTSELNRLYIAKGRSVLNWEWFIKANVPEDKIWNKTTIEVFKEGIGELIPHFGLFSLVGPLGAATYEWWPVSIIKQVGINSRIRIEVETRARRLQAGAYKKIDASFK